MLCSLREKIMFRRKNKKNRQQSPLEAIDLAIENIREEKQKNIKEIERIKKWAVDLIFEIYNVPKKYWYEEIENYEKIKQEEANKDIDDRIKQETDKIFNIYTGKIEILEKENQYLNEALEKLTQLKNSVNEKFDKSKKDIVQAVKSLERHSQRAQNIAQEDIRATYKTQLNVQLLEEEIENLKAEIEAHKQTEKEKLIISENLDITDFSIINDELDKLLKTIKKAEK